MVQRDTICQIQDATAFVLCWLIRLVPLAFYSIFLFCIAVLSLWVLFFYLSGEGSKGAESTANLIQNITLVRANSVYFGIKSTAKNTLNFHKCNEFKLTVFLLLTEKNENTNDGRRVLMDRSSLVNFIRTFSL